MYAYRSLEAWKHAHVVSRLALRATDRADTARSRDLFQQIRRAAVSVEANIVEGYALGTAGLYARHLRIALGSAAEAGCLIRLAGELGYLPEDDVKQAEEELGITMRLLIGLQRHPPSRFRDRG